MFLRIVGARSAKQFDIIEVKIPFDLNIIIYDINNIELLRTACSRNSHYLYDSMHMSVDMTAYIDCHRKPCNMCRICLNINRKSSLRTAKPARTDSK